MSINKNISAKLESEIGVVIETVGSDAVIELNPQLACESCGARLICVYKELVKENPDGQYGEQAEDRLDELE